LTLVHRVDRSRLRPNHLVRVSFQVGLDWPSHLDALKALRPELPDTYPTGVRLWTFAMWRVPRSVLAFFVWRQYIALTRVARHAGMTLALLLRSWEKLPASSAPARRT
jgi:hypothetical protein